MIVERYYLGKAQWGVILRAWTEKYTVIAPHHNNGNLILQQVDPDDLTSIVYDEARAVQPLKSYFIPPLDEVVGRRIEKKKPWLFLGIKACDLNALSLLDKVFRGDFPDPKYEKRREDSFIVSSDCTRPYKTCSCTWVGQNPYPESGFDLNLSKVWDGFVIQIGNQKGKSLLEGFDEMLKVVVKEEADSLQKTRQQTADKVKSLNADFKLKASQKELVTENYHSDVWAKHAETCVECGACNHACPTCHCYFIDDITRKKYVRLRGWDACQYSGYAVTAGGGTPRPLLVQRFRNRYLCKFSYLEQNYNQLGCTGCGRCIEACQGKIDMRETIKDLA